MRSRQSPSLQRAMDLSREKGASNWLPAIPIKEHGFNNKLKKLNLIARLRHTHTHTSTHTSTHMHACTHTCVRTHTYACTYF